MMRYGAEQGTPAKPPAPSLLSKPAKAHVSCSLLLAFFFLCCEPLAAETVDRLAITVGSTVITQLQIDEDLRVAALLNGQPVVRDLGARRAAADRLVEQLLIQHEIQLSRYPEPSVEEVNILYSRIEAAMGGSSRLRQLLTELLDGFESALELGEKDLIEQHRTHLEEFLDGFDEQEGDESSRSENDY